MKYIYLIIFTILLSASCKEADQYFSKDTPETVNSSMWDYLQKDSKFGYYTDLIKHYGLDSLFTNNNSYTLFIPSEEALDAVDTSLFKLDDVLLYQILDTQVNFQSIDAPTQVKTMFEKFALLEYNKTSGKYVIDGVSVGKGSSLFNNGCYYELEGCVMPPPNIYEYFKSKSAALKNYVDYTDSSYFDIESSTPIGISPKGTVYDSVFFVTNRFSEDFFPVKLESRDKFATFTIFTDQQYKNAIDIMKASLNIQEVPSVWLNEIFMPGFLKNCIFDKSLQYENFQPKMVNINGDSVKVNVSNINKDSRYICSNGAVYFFNDFAIPDSLYKSYSPIYAKDMVKELVAGSKWTWAETATVEGLDGTAIAPKLQLSSYAKKGSLFVLELGNNFDVSRNLRFTFTKKGVFGAEKIRLLWGGTSAYCGLWKIYINGKPVQMRTYSGVNADYLDSYLFTNTTIKSVTGLTNFKRAGNNYNTVDFAVKTMTEYSDVSITFEYVGPSRDFAGNIQGIPGIVIDYLLLEVY